MGPKLSPKLSLEQAIQKELGRVYLCTLEELCALLPQFSPSEVALAVEQLIQGGSVAYRSSEPSRSILWLPPTRPGRKTIPQSIPTISSESDQVGLESVKLDHEPWEQATTSTVP
jgi:hypothetical protein